MSNQQLWLMVLAFALGCIPGFLAYMAARHQVKPPEPQDMSTYRVKVSIDTTEAKKKIQNLRDDIETLNEALDKLTVRI